MPVDFDTTRAPLRVDDFVALVRAVKGARPSDECIWLEWKSSLDLSSARGKETVVRCIVGLANRLPEVAASYCEGRGYLVIGAEPGTVAGVTEVDPADLDNWWRPYLGTDGPPWAAHWVEVEAKTVLIVEVPAPRRGDPMYAVRKSILSTQDGDVIVRRVGSTSRADSAELRSLAARMVAPTRLHGLRVLMTEPAALIPVDFSSAVIEQWLTSEQEACLASLPSRRAESSPLHRAVQEFSGATNTLSGFARSLAFAATQPEDRSEEEYEAEVLRYIEACRIRLPETMRFAAGHLLPRCQFALQNETETNFPDVELRVHVEGDVEAVRAIPRAANEGRLPHRPRTFGPRPANPYFGVPGVDIPGVHPGLVRSAVSGAYPTASPVVIRNGGSTELRFRAVDVRPEDTVPLVPVVLLPQVPTGDTVVATWSATSKGASGKARGEITVSVTGAPWSVHDALQHRDDDSQNH
jgi:hypothetical protein